MPRMGHCKTDEALDRMRKGAIDLSLFAFKFARMKMRVQQWA